MLSPIQNDMSMVFPRPTSRFPTSMSSLGAKKGLIWWHALVDGDLQALPGDATLTVLEFQNIDGHVWGYHWGYIYI